MGVVHRRCGEPQHGLSYGTRPGNVAACFTHAPICIDLPDLRIAA